MINTETTELQSAQARLKAAESAEAVPLCGDEPQDFVCPITRSLMQDPVIAADGHSYERSAIEQWIATKRVSPKTNVPLHNTNLLPNHTLKAAIESFVESRASGAKPSRASGAKRSRASGGTRAPRASGIRTATTHRGRKPLIAAVKKPIQKGKKTTPKATPTQASAATKRKRSGRFAGTYSA